MAFRFELDESVAAGVRRVLGEQFERMRHDLEDPGHLGQSASVHDARRRAKKVRALARLVRPAVGDGYGPVNRAFRDSARRLAATRDAQVAVATFDALVAKVPPGVSVEALMAVRDELLEREVRATEALAEDPDAFGEALALAEKGARKARRWQVPDSFEAVAGGLATTYGRVVEGWYGCCAEPTNAAFHDWRKRVKYHRYHLDLLRRADPDEVEVRRESFHSLSDLLGEEHDTAVLLHSVLSEPGAFGPDLARRQLMVLGQRCRSRLRNEALVLGGRLTAESPEALTDRWRATWSISRIGRS